MNMLSVSKYDSGIALDKLKDHSLIELYDSSMLISSGKRFYSVLSSTRHGLPNSINVAVEDFRPFSHSSSLCFDFSAAKTWDSSIEPAQALPGKAIIDFLDHKIGQDPKYAYNKYLHSFERITDLLGLGEGLTPAGDDFITGALNASACFDHKLFASISAELKDVKARTTSLSSHFISIAMKKRASEDVIMLFQNLQTDNFKYLSLNVSDILDYGSSSGYYMLKGILWVLRKTL